MRHKKLQLSAILLLGLGLTGLRAQEAIPVTVNKINLLIKRVTNCYAYL